MDMTTTQVHMHAPVRTAPPKIRALPLHQNSGSMQRGRALSSVLLRLGFGLFENAKIRPRAQQERGHTIRTIYLNEANSDLYLNQNIPLSSAKPFR